MIRNVTESQKRRVAGRQRFKCAASIPDYTCPLKGEPFDESGYEIDHIQELRDGGSNELTNLQALCISCHRVKTTRNTSMGSKRVVAEIPPPVKLLCHHCHDQHKDTTLRNENGKWFCKMHRTGVCNYLGCFGEETVHVKVVSRLDSPEKTRVNLNDFAFKSKDPPGTVRSSGITPDGKVWNRVTYPRK